MRYTYILCVSVAAWLSWAVIWSAAADADLGDQLFKLLPDDGAADDWFGHSVAISGATAIVGAYFDEDNGPASGSAYLFDTTTGLQIAKLLPKDGGQGDQFGQSVAISGTTAIVGAFGDSDNGGHSGSAYLFDISDPANPTQIAKLLPNDGAVDDQFGFSVAISGAIAIVGAYRDDDNGTWSGSAYLFDTTTGEQIAKLLPNDGAADDRFGFSVAISGGTAIVGAYHDDDNDNDNGDGSGSAYLFHISDPTNPTQVFKLLANDGAQIDNFGTSVAISGNIAIVGAWRADGDVTSTGAAYLFDPATGKQIAKLLANDGELNDQFGISVAISPDGIGTTAIVGAWLHGDNGTWSGSAYLFDASFCPWDIDDNAVVGVPDLLWLLGSWGPCPPKMVCPADFDDSGDVGVKDLLILLGNWGPCP